VNSKLFSCSQPYKSQNKSQYATLQIKEELKRKQERLHILEGFMIAIDNSNYIAKIITGSANVAEAKEKLTRTLPIKTSCIMNFIIIQLVNYFRLFHLQTKFQTPQNFVLL